MQGILREYMRRTSVKCSLLGVHWCTLSIPSGKDREASTSYDGHTKGSRNPNFLVSVPYLSILSL